MNDWLTDVFLYAVIIRNRNTLGNTFHNMPLREMHTTHELTSCTVDFSTSMHSIPLPFTPFWWSKSECSSSESPSSYMLTMCAACAWTIKSQGFVNESLQEEHNSFADGQTVSVKWADVYKLIFFFEILVFRLRKTVFCYGVVFTHLKPRKKGLDPNGLYMNHRQHMFYLKTLSFFDILSHSKNMF